ncbi:unnamed protein product [Phytophthora lilii]|uniref:Unnamed protein product n=1 Tax=Phytophthora lilii TaxID=2077276 RepID=A0A9W6WPN5_9STRA|nr:unnamed protein product [Phytophthora lilii]
MTQGPESGPVDESLELEQTADENPVRYSFHVPPFNSIDHVHMHAFHDDPRTLGYYGRIKYRTESWWCRSYDQVMARLEEQAGGAQQGQAAQAEQSSSSSSGLLTEDRQTA